MKTVHHGSWADDGDAAVRVALAEVNVDEYEWLKLEYSDGYAFVSPDEKWRIDVEMRYSESRDQWKAVLRRRKEVTR